MELNARNIMYLINEKITTRFDRAKGLVLNQGCFQSENQVYYKCSIVQIPNEILRYALHERRIPWGRTADGI